MSGVLHVGQLSIKIFVSYRRLKNDFLLVVCHSVLLPEMSFSCVSFNCMKPFYQFSHCSSNFSQFKWVKMSLLNYYGVYLHRSYNGCSGPTPSQSTVHSRCCCKGNIITHLAHARQQGQREPQNGHNQVENKKEDENEKLDAAH